MTKTLRILIADDHDLMRRGIKGMLQSHAGWEICGEAHTGREAVSKAQELKPDIAILDISMPTIDGFDAAREIKRQLPDIPILFFSIYDDGEYLETARSLGEGVVLKEEAATMLLKAVDALLQRQTFFPNTGTSE